jgi:hypothetical protein
MNSLPPGDMDDITRYMTASKAAGKIVQPWQYHALLKEKMDAINARALQARSLSQTDTALGLQAARQNEVARMNAVNINQLEQDRDAAREAGKWRLGGQLGSAALWAGMS